MFGLFVGDYVPDLESFGSSYCETVLFVSVDHLLLSDMCHV